MNEPSNLAKDGESYELQIRRSALKARLLGLAPSAVEFGDYELERVVGKGASGVVFRARDRRLHRTVALKLLWAPSGSRRTSSLDEARALATVSHPNVVAVYEAGEFADCAFIAMEFVEGRSLRDWMDDDPTPDLKLDVLRQAAAGLAALHRTGITHGDFKPANALVGGDGRLRIVDFGLSSGVVSSRPPMAGGLGTWRYMAPEVRNGAPHSASSDQYALCRVGQELLPDGGPRRSSSRLLSVLQRGLEDDPADRFDSMEALCAALEPPPARRRKLWAAVGLGAVTMLVLGRSVANPDVPECTGQLLLTERSRAVLEQNLASSAESSWPLPGRDAKILQRSSSLLALGRWKEGCAFIEETLEEREGLERLQCMRASFCTDPSSLPRRARCFGGDVDSCEKLSIVHEFEYLDAQNRAASGATDNGLEYHRTMLLEATSEGCALGSAAMCDLADRVASPAGAAVEGVPGGVNGNNGR